MENDYLLEVRKIISKNDDSRIDMSMYKTAALITMVKNCDRKCPKCKEENVNCITKQTRGGDEGATELYVCLSCGYQWKYNN